jgi:hypothetical protein
MRVKYSGSVLQGKHAVVYRRNNHSLHTRSFPVMMTAVILRKMKARVVLCVLFLVVNQATGTVKQDKAPANSFIVVFDTQQLQQLAAGIAAATAGVSTSSHAEALPAAKARHASIAQATMIWRSTTAVLGQSVLADFRASRINATAQFCYGLLLDGCSYEADSAEDAIALQRMLSQDNRVSAVYPAVSWYRVCSTCGSASFGA